jgi:predicted amino acid dehydrogenase
MKHIISLSIGSASHNGENILDVEGQKVRLTRLGAEYNVELFYSWLEQMDGHCDLIALSDLPPPIKIKRKIFRHELLTSAQARLKQTPSTTGSLMQGMVSAWALEQAVTDGRFKVEGMTVTMLSSLWQQDLLRTLEGKVQKILCMDPWTFRGIPFAFEGHGNLETWAVRLLPWLKKDRVQPCSPRHLSAAAKLSPSIRAAAKGDIIVACATLLSRTDPGVLHGKTVLIDQLTQDVRNQLDAAQVHNAYAFRFGWRDTEADLTGAELEALLMIMRGADDPLTLDDVVQCVVERQIETQLEALYPERKEPVRRFAFVVHPLSRSDLFRHPLLKPFKAAPQPLQKLFERSVARAPGMRYGTLRGVVSQATGAEVEGILYSLFATPREMLAAEPREIYDRLVKIAEHAEAQGAKILGLGAFTKIVGDAGVTVAERSPIPVTTGNSLSAASTLWAARDVCQKLGFVTFDRNAKKRIQGRAMVIGATGSIGKACAKIMSSLFSEIVLAATNAYRLMQLSREIEQESPDVDIKVTTQPNRFADRCDLIVIATSAPEGGVLDIKTIKPGCVVCDVSRPLTYTADEAMQRPDVLIIESGEIDLPGHVKLDCDLGLSDSVVYACLAETAILALEGRYESYTLSRNINTKKVIEIYKMSKKHGAKLAEIRGPCGLVTDEEINLCREHAQKSLTALEGATPYRQPVLLSSNDLVSSPQHPADAQHPTDSEHPTDSQHS